MQDRCYYGHGKLMQNPNYSVVDLAQGNDYLRLDGFYNASFTFSTDFCMNRSQYQDE